MRPIGFLVFLLLAIPLAAQQYRQADIDNGRRLYEGNCARCHGPDGDALAAADIGHGKFRRAASDDEIVKLIISGIPNTEMQAANNISEQQGRTIVAYLRDMASSAARRAAITGDVSRGKSIFENKDKGACVSCHRVNGSGSRTGPDLSDVGQQRRLVDLERSILDPDASIVPNHRFFKIVTRDGVTVTGRLLNRDSFMVLLLDSKEQLRAFSIANLREHGFVEKSPMPSYRDKLTSQELADVVSYLASLKGVRP